LRKTADRAGAAGALPSLRQEVEIQTVYQQAKCLLYSEGYKMILRGLLGVLIGGGAGLLFNIVYRKITAGAGAT